MDFRAATDQLFARVTAADLAETIGVTQNSVARARVDSGSTAHRSPPPGWAGGVARLARERAAELLRLAEALERDV